MTVFLKVMMVGREASDKHVAVLPSTRSRGEALSCMF